MPEQSPIQDLQDTLQWVRQQLAYFRTISAIRNVLGAIDEFVERHPYYADNTAILVVRKQAYDLLADLYVADLREAASKYLEGAKENEKASRKNALSATIAAWVAGLAVVCQVGVMVWSEKRHDIQRVEVSSPVTVQQVAPISARPASVNLAPLASSKPSSTATVEAWKTPSKPK